MPTRALTVFALLSAACSSASSLPSGGPYGGSAFDAGISDDPEAGIVITTASTSSTISFTVGSGSSSTTSTSGSVTASTGSTATIASTATTPAAPPTWTYLYDTYLSATGSVTTIGSCDSSSCHEHTECSSASACYTWIGTGQYGALANNGGFLSWDNGYMPTTGPTSYPQAEVDFAAWIAAGSLDN